MINTALGYVLRCWYESSESPSTGKYNWVARRQAGESKSERVSTSRSPWRSCLCYFRKTKKNSSEVKPPKEGLRVINYSRVKVLQTSHNLLEGIEPSLEFLFNFLWRRAKLLVEVGSVRACLHSQLCVLPLVSFFECSEKGYQSTSSPRRHP